MENIINSYETLFITSVANGDEATKATVEKFTSLIASNGEIVEVSEWGKRRLAYPINDMNEGYYVVVTHKTVPSYLAELDRLFNIDETIMRSLTTICRPSRTARSPSPALRRQASISRSVCSAKKSRRSPKA